MFRFVSFSYLNGASGPSPRLIVLPTFSSDRSIMETNSANEFHYYPSECQKSETFLYELFVWNWRVLRFKNHDDDLFNVGYNHAK